MPASVRLGYKEEPQSYTGAKCMIPFDLLIRNPQFPLCLSTFPMKASTMNISQKRSSSSLPDMTFCVCIVSKIPSNSVLYPLSVLLRIEFLREAKSFNTEPSSVKSLQATASLSLYVPRMVFWVSIPMLS